MAKLGKKTKTLRYEWIFGDRESLIPKKISKKFEFKAKTWAKMTKKQDYFKPKLEFQSKKELAQRNNLYLPTKQDFDDLDLDNDGVLKLTEWTAEMEFETWKIAREQ